MKNKGKNKRFTEMLRTALNYLLYGTASHEEYKLNKAAAIEFNHSCAIAYFAMGVVASVVLLTVGRFIFAINVDWYYTNVLAYIECLAGSLIMLVVNIFFGKHSNVITTASVYLMMVIALICGIMVAVNNQFQSVTAYLAIIALISVMFILSPLGLMLTIITSDVLCNIILAFSYDPVMLAWNNKNILFVSLTSFVVGFSIIINRQAKITSDRRLSDLLAKDAMTDIYNRRSFEEALSDMSMPVAEPSGRHGVKNGTESAGRYGAKNGVNSDITVCVLDINSLKQANDSVGHDAGDELIVGAAEIIRSIFGPYGRCFRTGGDEFAILIDKPIDPATLSARLDLAMKNWHGDKVSDMSISYGFASSRDYPDCTVTELLKYADRGMYESKARYYSESGNERRK